MSLSMQFLGRRLVLRPVCLYAPYPQFSDTNNNFKELQFTSQGYEVKIETLTEQVELRTYLWPP